MSSLDLPTLFSIIWRQGPSLTLKLIGSARLAGQRALGIACLCPLPVLGLLALFICVYGNQTQILMCVACTSPHTHTSGSSPQPPFCVFFESRSHVVQG